MPLQSPCCTAGLGVWSGKMCLRGRIFELSLLSDLPQETLSSVGE